MAYLLLACQGVLAGTLLLASVSKMFHQEQFLVVLRLSGFPKLLIKPLALFLPALELFLALGLMLSTAPVFVFVISLTVALFCVFTLWMGRTYYKGLRLKCGCFGIGKANIGPGTIFRNILLIALSLLGLILAFHVQNPLFTPSFWIGITITCCGMIILLAWALQQALSVLNLSLAQLNDTLSRSTTSSQVQKQGDV